MCRVLQATPAAARGLQWAGRVACMATGDADIGALMALRQPILRSFHKSHQPVVLTANMHMGHKPLWSASTVHNDAMKPDTARKKIG